MERITEQAGRTMIIDLMSLAGVAALGLVIAAVKTAGAGA